MAVVCETRFAALGRVIEPRKRLGQQQPPPDRGHGQDGRLSDNAHAVHGRDPAAAPHRPPAWVRPEVSGYLEALQAATRGSRPPTLAERDGDEMPEVQASLVRRPVRERLSLGS
jgi:hypothetical protein